MSKKHLNTLSLFGLDYLKEINPIMLNELSKRNYIQENFSDLNDIYYHLTDLNRTLQAEIDFFSFVYDFCVEAKKDKELFINCYYLYPDTCKEIEIGLSKSQYIERIVQLYTSRLLHLHNFREKEKTVFEVIQSLISYKEKCGLVKSYATFTDICDRTSLKEDFVKTEINKLVQQKKVRYEKTEKEILIYLT